MSGEDPARQAELGEDPEVRRRLVEWSDARRPAWEAAVRDGDRTALRALYEEAGRLLDEESRERPGARAVLSVEATNAVVRAVAAEVHGERVLDLGCGPAPVATIAFAASGNGAVGVDVAASMVALARREAAGVAGARFLVGDGERLPFGDGVFGFATCDDTIEHVVDPARALAELARVIRPGGGLLLVSPNHGGVHVSVARAREALRGRRHPRRWYYIHDSHTVEFRWRELRRLLGPHWRLERAFPVGWEQGLVGWKGRLANRAVRVGPMWRLSSSLVLLLRRR